jgi:hypothetical protein
MLILLIIVACIIYSLVCQFTRRVHITLGLRYLTDQNLTNQYGMVFSRQQQTAQGIYPNYGQKQKKEKTFT